MTRRSYSEEPRNTEGISFLEGRIDSIEVGEWHPLPDGQGQPTQVHMTVVIWGLDLPFVLRFKGPKTLDSVITALATHRGNVWPRSDD